MGEVMVMDAPEAPTDPPPPAEVGGEEEVKTRDAALVGSTRSWSQSSLNMFSIVLMTRHERLASELARLATFAARSMVLKTRFSESRCRICLRSSVNRL